jgi:WD40 repeat protein
MLEEKNKMIEMLNETNNLFNNQRFLEPRSSQVQQQEFLSKSNSLRESDFNDLIKPEYLD